VKWRCDLKLFREEILRTVFNTCTNCMKHYKSLNFELTVFLSALYESDYKQSFLP
jgi:hypothetical protein